jgi:hypothetical protein
MSLTREEREELVEAIHEGAGLGGGISFTDMVARFHASAWGALCHNTGRCGRGYQPDDTSPEAKIYRLMSKAFGS